MVVQWDQRGGLFSLLHFILKCGRLQRCALLHYTSLYIRLLLANAQVRWRYAKSLHGRRNISNWVFLIILLLQSPFASAKTLMSASYETMARDINSSKYLTYEPKIHWRETKEVKILCHRMPRPALETSLWDSQSIDKIAAKISKEGSVLGALQSHMREFEKLFL